MMYKYSICYPDQEKIEYRNEPISAKEVLHIAKNYPWMDQEKLSNTLTKESAYYSPSLDFCCLDDGRSFGLSSDLNENNELEFSLWYKRPKKVKILFGLLGTAERKVLSDVSSINFEFSIKYLEHFVNGNFLILEELYAK